MKLRIQKNSVRLRLNRREVEQFGEAGRLEEVSEFGSSPENRLVYGIEISGSADRVGVRASHGEIRIVLPEVVAKAWIQTSQAAVQAAVALRPDAELVVLVEKEFRRVHGGNSDPDLYPNPLEGQDHP